MTSPVITKIISMQHSFTVSENEIAQYVIANTDTVVSSTITIIAQNTGTSEASINRFCKKIGYKGFNSFKVALAQGNFFNSIQTAELSHQDSFVVSISRDYNNMLVNTTAMLDENQVIQAAKAMQSAAHIYIFASPLTKMVAQELEFRFAMIGMYAKTVSDMNDARVYASVVTREDFIIAIAPSLFMRDFYNAISICKDNGAKILSITSHDSPKLANLIDFKFIISDKITTRYSVSISNTLMYMYVTDVLYCALLEGDKGLKHRRLNSDSILNNQQRMDNYFFEY